MTSQDIARAVRELRAGQESRSGALNALRTAGLPIILKLAEELLIRQIAREANSAKSLVKAIERQNERSEEELDA
jgi:hypothetical protein